MNLDSVAAIAGSIVTVALVFTVVSHAGSADIIKAIGASFSSSISAAEGK